jgi:hypothetical protein
MSINPAPAAPEGSGQPVRPARPRSIDYAVWAILARCVFALGAAFALYGTRADARRTVARANPTWTARQIEDYITSAFRSSMVVTIVSILLVLLLAKLIRDGRNWSRWLFAVLVFIVLGDVQRVFGFFASGSVAFQVLSGLTGLSAAAALVLLFLPASNAHFRRPGTVAVSPLRALLGARTQPLRTPASSRSGTSGSGTVDPATAESPAQASATSPFPRRPAPRAKSRNQRTE